LIVVLLHRERVSTSTAATRAAICARNTTRPSLAGSGIGRWSRVRMSSGQVTTSRVDAPAGDVDHHERAVAASRVYRPIEPRRLPRALQPREDVVLRVPNDSDLGPSLP